MNPEQFDMFGASWVSGHNAKFNDMDKNSVKQMMGTVVDKNWQIHGVPKVYSGAYDFPDQFDSRSHWPECSSVTGHVRDQSNCGSCWAHGTTEAFNDRLCIASGGKFTELLSVADTTGCCKGLKCLSYGCNGGQVSTPWAWFASTGVVSGGDYGDGRLCYDYTIPPCQHHSSGDLPDCSAVTEVQPTCPGSCPTNPSIDYQHDKRLSKTSYHLKTVNDIKQDIYLHGSATGAFTVYEDFLTYKSGVYQHLSGDSLGGHAIKIIGWGTENDLDYWLCVNSWNTTWGDNGTFKILVGDSGINDSVYAGLV